MSTVDVKKLKQLRESTGVSFSYCKRALEESNNDIDIARKKLSEWSAAQASKKSDRDTSQGGIFAYVHHNKRMAALVELRCETDFVAKNADFQNLGKEIAMQVATMPAKDIEELLLQTYIRQSSKTINGLIQDAVMKLGENIKVRRFVRWEVGE